jgi:hypothetical protein
MTPRDEDLDKTPILLHPRIKVQMFKPGVDLFNEEKYFEAHEEWEKLWKMEMGVDRTWLQGLIQVAGHYVLIGHHRYHASYRMALHALEKLSVSLSMSSVYRKFDLEPIVSGLHYNMQILAPHIGSYKSADLGEDLKEAMGAPLGSEHKLDPAQFLYPKLFE